MPRGARLDAEGALHHVMGRGIERRDIFLDDRDREMFVARLARVQERSGMRMLAWALMPNHFHLLVQTAGIRLSRAMRWLLTGYAMDFNRRHERVGHVFQNRFKSILCEREPYFLELVRYVHLNPVRGHIVEDIAALADYPFTGHATLVGSRDASWQDTESVLAPFGSELAAARKKYIEFVRLGLGGCAPVPPGGGLVVGVNGPRYVADLRRGREAHESHERVLGSQKFVEAAVGGKVVAAALRGGADDEVLERLLRIVADDLDVSVEAICARDQTRRLATARQVAAYIWVELLARSGARLALRIGRTRGAIYAAAKRGEAEMPRCLKIAEQVARQAKESRTSRSS